jgi:hypothetical protein
MQPAAAEGPNALDGRAPAETFQLVPAKRRPSVAVTPPPPLRQLPPTMMQSLKNGTMGLGHLCPFVQHHNVCHMITDSDEGGFKV